MAVLSYLGILVLIPIFSKAKNDRFVKFHIRQGLALFIVSIIVSFGGGFLSGIMESVGGLIYAAASIFVFVLLIMGIVNAATGKMNKLPLIGDFADSLKI